MKEFEWFEWFEWFGPSPIEPFNSVARRRGAQRGAGGRHRAQVLVVGEPERNERRRNRPRRLGGIKMNHACIPSLSNFHE